MPSTADKRTPEAIRGRHIDWSPVVERLAFMDGFDDLGGPVYSIAADGSDRRRIVNNAFDPVWSPDGSQIAFLRWIRRDSPDIFVVDVATKGVRRLTRSGRYEWSPVWSPNGKRLAVARDDNATSTTSIFVMDADGRHLRQVTHPPKRSDDGNPDWSPDGSQIAFDRAIERGPESEVIARPVLVVGSDGRGLRRLSHVGEYSYGPVWSPDGAQVAYGTEVANNQNGINVVNSDGTEPRRLTNDGGLPGWSPDGTKIAFVSARDDPPGFDQVYVMNADGSNQRRVSHTGTSDTELLWLE